MLLCHWLRDLTEVGQKSGRGRGGHSSPGNGRDMMEEIRGDMRWGVGALEIRLLTKQISFPMSFFLSLSSSLFFTNRYQYPDDEKDLGMSLSGARYVEDVEDSVVLINGLTKGWR